ncbi:MAG: hypothetical protein ACTHL3_02550 [Candidatus Nitrosocosmicus sp.]
MLKNKIKKNSSILKLMLTKITTSLTAITIIVALAIFSITVFEIIVAKIYSAGIISSKIPFTRLSVPLTPDEIQFVPNQIMFHLDNQTSGAIESTSNETGKDIRKYYTYNPKQNTVTISNSTIYTHYNIQIPNPNNPNTTLIQTVNRAFEIKSIFAPDHRFSIISTTYFGEINKKYSSTNGIT